MFYHVYLFIVSVTQLVNCYNIETEPYKIFDLPKWSNADLFGFSFDSNRQNIWIGAPKSIGDKIWNQEPEGTGRVFQCNLDDEKCRTVSGLLTENTQAGFSQSQSQSHRSPFVVLKPRKGICNKSFGILPGTVRKYFNSL